MKSRSDAGDELLGTGSGGFITNRMLQGSSQQQWTICFQTLRVAVGTSFRLLNLPENAADNVEMHG